MIRNVMRKAEISFDLPGCRWWLDKLSDLFHSFKWVNLMIRRSNIHLRYQSQKTMRHSGRSGQWCYPLLTLHDIRDKNGPFHLAHRRRAPLCGHQKQ